MDEGFAGGFTLNDSGSFARIMMELYQYRCGVTHQQFSSIRTLPHPDLEVFFFRPPMNGGKVSFRNAVVVTGEIYSLMLKGRIFIDSDYGIQVRGETLVTVGSSLVLTADRQFWPDAEALAYHRRIWGL